MAQQCWKSCANESNIVARRFGDHGTKEILGVVGWKLWPVSNFAQQHPTTWNRAVQTDATCNIQQCWELLANNVASVSTGPKTEGSKEFNFWKYFYFALSENYLLQRHATHVCFHIIYQYRSSYIIKHWPAGNFMKNESLRAYYRSSPRESSIKRITRIVSQNLERAKQLTATTSTSKTAMSQTVVDNRMWYAI